MKKTLCILGAMIACVAMAAKPVPTCTEADGLTTVTFKLGAGEHIYTDGFGFTALSPDGATAKDNYTIVSQSPSKDLDGMEGWEDSLEVVLKVKPNTKLSVTYQACDAQQCYAPTTVELLTSTTSAPVAPKPTVTAPPATATTPAAALPTMRSAAGFLNTADFLAFLRNEQKGGFTDDPIGFVKANGIWLMLLIVFCGGILLNLTPCVLPMMPINLAIIGAGAQGGSRVAGALRGGAYGLGIALAYGCLGLLAVLTGSAFGTIQSSPWFNSGIAVVFVLLSLSLFDLFFIDFTKFAGGGAGGNQKQGTIAAFVAGAVSAVLAGACVAPVLIAVLLLTADYWAQGSALALALPFVLGLGMAAPWPIAGAGLSLLPKPGMWMMRVKQIFGVVVLLFAAYYGWVAYQGFFPKTPVSTDDGSGVVRLLIEDRAGLEAVLARGKAEGRPVFIDIWATWCKNCEAMELKTFKDEPVVTELKNYIVVKIQAEKLDGAVAKELNLQGLPTYFVTQ